MTSLATLLASLDREARAKLAALDRSQAVAEFGLDGTILQANANFLALFGYTLEEIRGRKHAIFVEPVYAASEEYRRFWLDLGAGAFKRAEFRRLAKDGREVWIQASYNPVIDRGGRPYAIVKVATDVTADVERAIDYAGQIEALHRSQAITEFALDGTVLFANRNFLDLFGYELAEVAGRHHRMFVDDAYAQSEEYRRFWASLRRGEAQTGEFRRLGKGRRHVYIQASYNPIVDRDNRPTKIVKVATDVTAQVEAQLLRARIESGVRGDLSAMADATRDVARQAAAAASRASSVLSDVEVAVGGTETLDRSAEALSRQVATAFSMSDQAVTEAKATTGVIVGLSARAERIGEVTALIDGIASRTNLLALNATIEAARAGEAGRGFAVVAQEVKALATQTARATGQIGAQITAVQEATTQAAEAMGSIQTTIARLNDLASIVETAIRRQETVVRDISRGMRAASESASAINASMATIAEATDVLDQTTQKVRVAAQQLR